MTRHWYDIDPKDATDIVLPRDDIDGPIGENGEPCPWPWEPQQLVGAPIGMYHCPYCGSMVMAGVPHPDYRDADKGYDDWDSVARWEWEGGPSW